MALTQAQQILKKAIAGKLHRHFGREVETANREQLFRACALAVRDVMNDRLMRSKESYRAATHDDRKVHYLSLEFLLGRSLQKNIFNLGLQDDMAAVLEDMSLDITDLFDTEPDAGLGNGGLGRLAACYLDSMTTLGIPASGYTICYHYGIFKQRIVDGQQVELPDPWMEVGDVWLIPRMDEVREVHFGGRIEQEWGDGQPSFRHVDYTSVLAVPMDMPITGFRTDHANTLRLWDAKSPTEIDMTLFSQGEYLKAIEQNAMAEVIAKVLYPEDNHFEGKLLRLRQQYFFVSATVQDIVAKHKAKYGNLHNFHLKHVLQINDTHPTWAIPELMRILLDEEGFSWEETWSIVTHSVAYTNHTILSEALECWPQNIVEMLLPRIWQIICEINNRYCAFLRNATDNEGQVAGMAIVWDGQVRMANLCVATCMAINGVSELHSRILRDSIFHQAFEMMPSKFKNVTNGVDHRRWLAQINPPLDHLICDLLGSDAYLTQPRQLEKLAEFRDDKTVLDRLAEIKRVNKLTLAEHILRTEGIAIDPESIFDVQVKRLHEYKRQLLNVMHIIHLYNKLRENPDLKMHPRTFLFGAKAAPGYYMAKKIIQLINSLAAHINADPVTQGKLKVVFLQNYRVSLAELLMPASEVSEQISLAGKEASGTGNMKFMMNGALTVGTMDGANVEMCQAAGEENFFIFGMRTPEVQRLVSEGSYNPSQLYTQNQDIRAVLDQIAGGFSDGLRYDDIVGSLLFGGDTYMLLGDFVSYCDIQAEVDRVYGDPERWNRMSLLNIAASGRFASDRSIQQYAKYIWYVDTAYGNRPRKVDAKELQRVTQLRKQR